MKKLLKNKKGFTLVELLAVIVVLAIIMVIAATSVTNAMATARLGSYKNAYKMLEKDIKQRILSNTLNSSEQILCGISGEPDCDEVYEISAADYTMKVSKDASNDYILELSGKTLGKFDSVKISKDADCPVSGSKVEDGNDADTAADNLGCKSGSSSIKVKFNHTNGNANAQTVS